MTYALVPGPNGHLAERGSLPHNGWVEDNEATQLTLETLFELRWRVRDNHYAVVEDDDGEEKEEEDA